MRELVVCGAGGHAREVLDVCRRLGRTVRALIDETTDGSARLNGLPVLRGLDAVPDGWRGDVEIFPGGVGSGALRERFASRAMADDWLVAGPLIAPDVYVDSSVDVGRGTYVAPGAQLSVDIEIGSGVSVGRGAIVSHDCVILDYVSLAPRVALGGAVHLGEHSFVGIGAAVRDHVRIGRNVRVGGGAFVHADVDDALTVVGVPARPLRGV